MEGLFSCWRIGQQGQDLVDFMEGSRPSVYEYQGDGILMRRSLMHEMNRHFSKLIHIYGKCELRQFIDFGFMGPPIVLVEPMVPQTLDFSEGCAVYQIKLQKRKGSVPSQLTPSSWSGRRAEESLLLVWSRRESGTWILKGVGNAMACWSD